MMNPVKREIYITITLLVLSGAAAILTTADLAQRLGLAWHQGSRVAVRDRRLLRHRNLAALRQFRLSDHPCRLWRRRLAHRPKPLELLKAIYDAPSVPAVCILIPFLQGGAAGSQPDDHFRRRR